VAKGRRGGTINTMTTILIYISTVPVKKNLVANLPANSRLKDRARTLRKAGNYAEVVFWQQVHKGKFHAIDFDRQKIIGNYIVDFYIEDLGLVIEIDGESHNIKEDYDEKRDSYFKSLGLKIYRTNDFNVLHDLGNVLKQLEEFIVEHYS
jgi:very-short-patch-repair endonuclease